MAIKFQYNRTSLGEMDKALKMRRNALPTLKNKESALRLAAISWKKEAKKKEEEMEELMRRQEGLSALWNEFPAGAVRVRDVKLRVVKIAGVRCPDVEEVLFDIAPFNVFQAPSWIPEGIQILKEIACTGIIGEVYMEKAAILEHSRKKTTQKVNLYEKVQIPGYEEAIRKIKRFMEDEENLSKASQKIVKKRHEAAQQHQEEEAL